MGLAYRLVLLRVMKCVISLAPLLFTTKTYSNSKMDELEEISHHSGGIYNYFEGATIHNLVINGNMNKHGSEHYHEKDSSDKRPKATKEQIARALVALNGKDNVIDSQRAWLGACLLLGWKYGFPRNLNDCCKQIEQMPIDMAQLEFQCKYESIRMFGCWKFVKENYDSWATLVPRDEERQVFEKCLSVAQALDQEIVIR